MQFNVDQYKETLIIPLYLLYHTYKTGCLEPPQVNVMDKMEKIAGLAKYYICMSTSMAHHLHLACIEQLSLHCDLLCSLWRLCYRD